MSYFKCSHGQTYYPFGKLSHQKLKKEMMLASDPNYISSINIHRFPLTSQLSDLTGSNSNEDEDKETFDDENYDLNEFSGIPFVERNPTSEVAGLYSNLCHDVLSEIFKIQINSQLVVSTSVSPHLILLISCYSFHS